MTPETAVDGGALEELSVDMALELVSQYQRRAMLRYLVDVPGQVTSLEDLIDHLLDVERAQGGSVPGEDYLLALLVHVHGPKLEEAGVVTYDIPEQRVRYHGDERVERLLDRIEDVEAEW